MIWPFHAFFPVRRSVVRRLATDDDGEFIKMSRGKSHVPFVMVCNNTDLVVGDTVLPSAPHT